MFRNLRFYRLDGPWPDDEAALSGRLEGAAFRPCGPLTERSSGFVPVYPDAGESLARRVNGADLMKLRSQSRVLPAAAVTEALEARLDAFRQRTGEEPPAREKRRLKAETRDELLKSALLKSDHVWGYVDIARGVLGIDSAGEPNAERFLRRLKAAAGELPIKPLAFGRPLDEFLKKVLLGGAPRQFALGRECRMQDPKDPKSIVRWSGFDLSDKSIRDHVADGMRLTHLAIEYDHVASFVMDVNGVITKLKFPNTEADDDLDALQNFDAGFVLATGTVRNLLADLESLLGGPSAAAA